MLQFSLVFMLQERGPRQKTRLMTDIITFGVGNSTILNQDGKMKILSHVACFYSKCLAKMKNERPAWQCFLTISALDCRDVESKHGENIGEIACWSVSCRQAKYNRDTWREPAEVFEWLHQSSRPKQAPDNQEQKEIDASKFDAEDENHKGVPNGTERP